MNGFYGNEIKKVPQRLKRACVNRRFLRAISIGRNEYPVMKTVPQGLLMTAKLMSRSVCFEPISKSCFVSGHDFSRAEKGK
jgi:hypothetical protein